MIKEFSDQLFQKLKDGLLVIAAGELKPAGRLRDQLALIRSVILELNVFVKVNPLVEEAAEVEFYKDIYPKFKAQLIYHVELYNMQLNAPVESPALLVSHYKLYFSVCMEWVEQFRFYHTYRKLEAQELDSLYFRRSADQRSALLPVLSELDELGTAVGYLYAKFIAYEMLYDFICAEMTKLVSLPVGNGNGAVSRFKWTGKAIDLIEVAHGLHLEGQINNGQAGIVDFFSAFGEFFGVDLGIPKKGLDNLMDRKTVSRTRFTDRMRQSLQGKMDELEKFDPDRLVRKMRL